MAVSKQEILDTISNMTVLEVVDLIEAMEQKFGVSAAVVAAVAPGAGEAAAAKEEVKEDFDVVLVSFGENKVAVIKAVRAVTGLGLKEAKDLVESAPAAVVKEAAPKADAEAIKKQLEDAGGTVELK